MIAMDYMNNEPTISDVLEAVNEFSGRVDGKFLQVDQQFADVRSGIAGVRSEVLGVKQNMEQMKSDLVTEIDRFVVLHQTLDVELVSLRSRCDRMEARMDAT